MIVKRLRKLLLQTLWLLFAIPLFAQSYPKTELINSAFLGFFSIDQADSIMKKNRVSEGRKVVIVGNKEDSLTELSFDKNARLVKKKIWHTNLTDTILLNVNYSDNKMVKFEYLFPRNTAQQNDVLGLSYLLELLHIAHEKVSFSCEIKETDSFVYNLKIYINSKLYLDSTHVKAPWFEVNNYDSLSVQTSSTELKDGESVIIRTEKLVGGETHILKDSLSSSGKRLISMIGVQSNGKINWLEKYNFYYDIETDSLTSMESHDMVNNSLIECKYFTYDQFHKLSSESTFDFLNKSCELILFDKGRLKFRQFTYLTSSAFIPHPFFSVTAFKYLNNGLIMAEITTMNNEIVKSNHYDYLYW